MENVCLRTVLFFFFLLVFFPHLQGQDALLNGWVRSADDGEPLVAATIRVGNTGTVTDFNGSYRLSLPAGQHLVTISYVGYQNWTGTLNLGPGEERELNVSLEENATLLQTATVTSGKYERALGEVTVSLEVVRPQLINSVNATSIDEVLGKVPGLDIIDGQANIRGGSGWSFGAGSRVLLLIDDIPILQPDAGFPFWDDVPVENIEQVEVVKGAASALYGAYAMNGIINVRTSYARAKPETRISSFFTRYDDMSDRSQVWYDRQPYQLGGSVSHKRKIGRLDLVLGAYFLDRNSFNRDTENTYGRFNLGTRYRVNDKVTIGFNSNFNPGESRDFFYWKGIDSLFVGSASTLSTSERLRFNIDPYLSWYDPAGNRHKLQGRYFFVDNNNNQGQANASSVWYSEYQFQRNWAGLDLVTTGGVVYTGNTVDSELYNNADFSTLNLAAYLQLEKKFMDRLNTSLGFRYEFNQLDRPEEFCWSGLLNSFCDTLPGGKQEESRPVWRLGANYQLADYSFLRASWGQGYRFPTLAEAFIVTQVSGVPVSPNPRLESETGWSAELGIKQGFQLFSFNGFLDIAAFWSRYDNMMEFNLDPDLFNVGFRSINIPGGVDIRGLEFSVAGQGQFFGLPTNILAGYQYLDPTFREFDPTPPGAGEEPTEAQRNALNSSSDENILKYRFRHTAKIDLESTYRHFTLGFALNYYSFMEALDERLVSLIIPDLRQFRQENDRGTLLLSARMAYRFWQDRLKVSLIANNLGNQMYTLRPGIMEAPRNYTIRVDWEW